MFIVKWSKYFVNGSLKGLWFDASLDFDSLDAATHYMAFLHGHVVIPVKAIGGTDYTCHMATLVKV